MLGLASWIGVTVVAATRVEPGNDQLVTTTFAVAGAIFFTLIFGYSFLQVRRSGRRVRHDLYERLTTRPVSSDVLRAAARGSSRIANVYLSFGVVVTALGLVAVAARDSLASTILAAMLTVIVVWAVVAVWVLSRTFHSASTVFEPLGLALTATPTYRYSALAGRGWMTGATTYAGERNGRQVAITHEAARAVTVVRPATATWLPSDRTQMALLTGQQTSAWKDVRVTAEENAVVVVRDCSGAGSWFLHDLLLAESVADRA